jgi:hypothetical protein
MAFIHILQEFFYQKIDTLWASYICNHESKTSFNRLRNYPIALHPSSRKINTGIPMENWTRQ